MEKRLKVSEFAEIVGCTPKTVYKMIERNELNTVTEKVNFRETTVIVTNDQQLEDFQKQFGKLPVNGGECNEIVTDNYGNEPVKNINNHINNNDLIEKVIKITKDYTDQLKSYNDELINYKSQVLLLEDKQKAEQESIDRWKQEYYEKEAELKTIQRSKMTVIVSLVIVIVVLLLLLLTVSLLFSFEKQKHSAAADLTVKEAVIEQPLPVNNTPPQKTTPQQNAKNNKKSLPKK